MSDVRPERSQMFAALDCWIDAVQTFRSTRALANRVAAGDKGWSAWAKGYLLSPDDERRHVILARHGDFFSRNALIMHSMRCVAYEAQRYCHGNVDRQDLIQEGIFGVCRAIERFDIARNVRFTTYSKWWIRDAIQRAVARSRNASAVADASVGSIGLRQHADRRRLEQTYDAPATSADGSAWIEFDGQRAAVFDDASGELGYLPRYTLTRNERVSQETPEELFAEQQNLRLLRHSLTQLDDRERRVLTDRFGLGGSREHTLNEVAHELGMTCEGVRKLQLAALRKLRVLLARTGAEGIRQ